MTKYQNGKQKKRNFYNPMVLKDLITLVVITLVVITLVVITLHEHIRDNKKE